MADICCKSRVSDVISSRMFPSLYFFNAFVSARTSGKIATIGIGDGGNEIGMGKLHQRVVEHVQNGATIASIVPADHLITAGVSNWGGSALAAALFILNQCPVHSRYVRRGVGNECFVPVEQVLNTVKQVMVC